MSSVFIVARREGTAFGAFGGFLKGLSATELGVVSSKAALAQANNLDPSLVDAVCFGNVIQSSSDAAYLARHVGLKSGLPVDNRALTIHRLCGSKTCPWHPSKPPDSKHDGEASDSARESISNDEHPRPETSLDKFSGLKPVFKKDGVVTAANVSGICNIVVSSVLCAM